MSDLPLGSHVCAEAGVASSAAAAKAIATPITDMRGTAEFRNHLVGVLVERVVKAAIARARGETVCYKPGH